MSATIHPKPDDYGQPVVIQNPSAPSPLSAWNDPAAVATVIPRGQLPAELNGIQFEPWSDHPKTATEWNSYAGLMPDLVEPAMQAPAGKKASAGVVIVEDDDRVWLVAPTNSYGGYDCTWPKGRVEPGMSLQSTAVREAWEESGLKVRIVGLLGDFDRTTTRTRYYIGERIGGDPGANMGWESQAVSLSPLSALPRLLNGAADAPVLAALTAWIASRRA